jgi:DNA-damage-inducible protein J
MKSSTVHARIDLDTKTSSEKILRSIGMNPSDAVRLLYRQISLRKEFPVELRVPNELTAETLDKSDRGEGVETFESIEEFAESLKNE